MKNNVFIRLFLLSICLITGISATNAQIITTYAGNGTNGYSGDGGSATAAELHNPISVVVDGNGNVYFSETVNNCIRKVSTSGIISTFAGKDTAGFRGDGGPATAALFNSPGSIGIDGAGNIYVADWGNNVVRKINTSGIISTVAGTGAYGFSGDGGPAIAAQLNKPNIAVDPDGNIYIADHYNYRIRKVNTSGIISTIAGTGVAGYSGDGGPAISAQINPYNIAVDSIGNVYYVDGVSSVYRVIRKITPSGTINMFLDIWAEAMVFDGSGNMYFSEVSCLVRRVTPYGTVKIYAGNGYCNSTGGDGDTATHEEIKTPVGLALDAARNLYIAESNGARIRKVTYVPTGINSVSGNVETLSVYPNPTSKAFTIEMPSAKDKVSIIISDLLGKVIETRSIDSNTGIKEKFDVKNFVPGTYLIKISAGGKTYREKVLVR